MGGAGRNLGVDTGAPWRNTAAPAGSDLYYGTLFCPPAVRDAIRCLHAFAREMKQIPRTITDPGVARIKLAWWREEVSRLEQRTPAHPITVTLAASPYPMAGDADHIRSLHDMIEVREAELTMSARTDYNQVIADCRRSHGALWQLCAAAAGGDPDTTRAAETIGCAFGIHEILHDLHADLPAGRFRLPTRELERHGVRPDSLPALPAETLHAISTHAAGQIRQLVLEGIAALPRSHRPTQLALLTMTELMVRQLDEEQADGFRYLERRVMLTPLRKLWIAVRTRRRERRLARHHGGKSPA